MVIADTVKTLPVIEPVTTLGTIVDVDPALTAILAVTLAPVGGAPVARNFAGNFLGAG